MSFARFMSGPVGRGLRIVAGAVLVVVGVVLAVGSASSVGALIGGVALVVVGAAVFVAGTINVCFIAPIIGAPFRGRDARA